jgi:hypothetical protein
VKKVMAKVLSLFLFISSFFFMHVIIGSRWCSFQRENSSCLWFWSFGK